jgi:hypothetical protein
MMYMATIERDQVFQLRLSSLERKMLDRLADARGVTGSEVLRKLLTEEFMRLFQAELKKHMGKKPTEEVDPRNVRMDQLTTFTAQLGQELGKKLATPKKPKR